MASRIFTGKLTGFGQNAVELKKVEVTYGKISNSVKVLNGIDLEISEGTIYGLLGPSGCGKTTLLRCIVGKIKPEQGTVRVFGVSPGSTGSSVPGRGVGYMPQEIALYREFTIVDLLTYYGNLYGLEKDYIDERIEFLVKFLDLPDKNRIIKSLSIWNHLLTLAKTQKMTIIITTHYIEEARQANVVGLLRRGRLLANSEPGALMRLHNVDTLEEVFLKLCEEDAMEECNNVIGIEIMNTGQDQNVQMMHTTEQSRNIQNKKTDEDNEISSIIMGNQQSNSSNDTPIKWGKRPSYYQPNRATNSSARKTRAMIIKNVSILSRNYLTLLIQILLPSVLAALFCICVGREPFDLKVAVVNKEVEPNFGLQFLNSISKDSVIQLEFNKTEDAVKEIHQGKLWAVITIEKNYSDCLYQRFTGGTDVKEETIECSTIKIQMDMANPPVTYTLFKAFLHAFQSFALKSTEDYGVDPLMVKLPLQMVPVYGSLNPNFPESMLPGFMIIVIFILAESFPALSLMSEKRDGLMERDWIAGATETNVILALAITQFFVMVVQVLVCHFVLLIIFEINLRGSYLLLWSLSVLQGTCGMACGVAIATIANQENTAILLLLGTFFPNIFLSGMMLPIEAMPYILRFISCTLPLTFATEAMRSLFARGWDFSHDVVWQAYAITWYWITVYFILSRIALNMKK